MKPMTLTVHARFDGRALIPEAPLNLPTGQTQVSGRQVHYARLAAFALAHSVDGLLTLNLQDFA
ncbi:MAG: hypothetical protein RMK45_05030 [Armatimonadota bacterium]|nr:hypothetical protein [Armatimonadota bacterium]